MEARSIAQSLSALATLGVLPRDSVAEESKNIDDASERGGGSSIDAAALARLRFARLESLGGGEKKEAERRVPGHVAAEGAKEGALDIEKGGGEGGGGHALGGVEKEGGAARGSAHAMKGVGGGEVTVGGGGEGERDRVAWEKLGAEVVGALCARGAETYINHTYTGASVTEALTALGALRQA
jgi:hypothetical protein